MQCKAFKCFCIIPTFNNVFLLQKGMGQHFFCVTRSAGKVIGSTVLSILKRFVPRWASCYGR